MTETVAPKGIKEIFEDIDEAAKIRREKELENAKFKSAKERLSTHFESMLRNYGSSRLANLDSVGRIKRSFSREETPYLELDMNGQKIKIKAVERVIEDSMLELRKDGYTLLGDRGNGDEELFVLGNKVINWKKEGATSEQMNIVDNILYTMDRTWGFKTAPKKYHISESIAVVNLHSGIPSSRKR